MHTLMWMLKVFASSLFSQTKCEGQLKLNTPGLFRWHLFFFQFDCFVSLRRRQLLVKADMYIGSHLLYLHPCSTCVTAVWKISLFFQLISTKEHIFYCNKCSGALFSGDSCSFFFGYLSWIWTVSPVLPHRSQQLQLIIIFVIE